MLSVTLIHSMSKDKQIYHFQNQFIKYDMKVYLLRSTYSYEFNDISLMKIIWVKLFTLVVIVCL